MTTPEQLDQFAISLRSKSAWTPDIQQQLMDLIREPAMQYRGQLIPPNDRTKAMDNLFRCRPTQWNMDFTSIGHECICYFRLWYQSLSDTQVVCHEGVSSGELPYYSGALAIAAGTAAVWAYIMRMGGTSDFIRGAKVG